MFMNFDSFEKLNNLSEEINSEVQKSSFGDGIDIVRLDNLEKYNEVINSGFTTDYRLRKEKEESSQFAFKGLAFDMDRIRTQSYYLKDKEKIAAIMTFAISPKKLVTEQRYLRKTDKGVEICDFKSINKEDPEFVISPAWTKVDQAYLTKFAIPGFKMFKNVLQVLENKSPKNTWTEIMARGANLNQAELMELVNKKNVGDFIYKEELPFDLEKIGIALKESESTSKMAKLLNIPELPDVGNLTLGPVFAKKIKK